MFIVHVSVKIYAQSFVSTVNNRPLMPTILNQLLVPILTTNAYQSRLPTGFFYATTTTIFHVYDYFGKEVLKLFTLNK